MEDKVKVFCKNLIPYLIIVIVVVLIRCFIFTPIQVDGSSMYPTLEDNEILLLKKFDKRYDRFDIVVFDYKDSYGKNTKLIKRIIGLPGESIEYKDNKLYVNGIYVREKFISTQETYDFSLKELGYNKIPEGYYFVLGDNRTNSTDSRIIGLISKEQIDGISDFSIFPFSRFGVVS